MELQKLRRAFAFQANSARGRGVPFLLSFDEWLKVWTDSGHLERRGRRSGCYVMGRKGDAGAYEIGNVEIVTVRENMAISAQRFRPNAPSLRGVYLSRPGDRKPWRAAAGNRYLGMFATADEARAARARWVDGHPEFFERSV